MTITLTPPFPPPGPSGRPLSAEEFQRLFPQPRYELVRGVVRERSMPGVQHSDLIAELTYLLKAFIRPAPRGRVLTADASVLLERGPDTVRGMDVGYVSFDRLPRDRNPETMLEVVPELAVEVRSPSDLWTEVFAKADEYLRAGVTVVLIVDAKSRTVMTLRAGAQQVVYHVGDTVTVEDVLPGFRLDVGELFREIAPG